MAKTVGNKKLDTFQKTTIVFGYNLFVLAIIGITVSTVIPFSKDFFDPSVRYLNVAMVLVSLVAGAVLPILLAYILGDRATRTKNTAMHHFNGILFAIAAYWLSVFFGFVQTGAPAPSNDTYATLINSWPILATALVMTIVALRYAYDTGKKSVIEQPLYQVVLFGGFIATFSYLIANQYFSPATLPVILLMYVVIPCAMIGVSYHVIKRRHALKSARLTAATIAVSVGFIAATYVGQVVSVTNSALLIPIIVGFFAWLAYLVVIRR